MLVLVSNTWGWERTSIIYKYPLSKNQKFLRLKLLPHKQPLVLEDKQRVLLIYQGPISLTALRLFGLYDEYT